jgi:hypothetical protein
MQFTYIQGRSVLVMRVNRVGPANTLKNSGNSCLISWFSGYTGTQQNRSDKMHL